MSQSSLSGVVLALVVTLAASGMALAQGGDDCNVPTPITGVGSFSFDTTSATSTPSDPATCVPIDKDVWFEWTAPVSGKAIASTCGLGNSLDTILVVYAGNDCTNMLELACSDDEFDCEPFSAVYFPVMGGNIYRFRIGGQPGLPGGPGMFALSVSGTVPNDECSGATELTGTGNFPFDNQFATTSAVGHEACGNPGRDVWFRWTAPQSLPTTITTCRLVKEMETVLVLYADECPVDLPLACNDSSPQCVAQARIDFEAVAGTSYLIRIGSREGATFALDGRFSITQDDGSGANTIIVSTVYDRVDFPAPQLITSLPGPDGEVSFREAVIAANNTPGPQTIEFGVRRSQWYYQGNVAEILNEEGNPFILTDDGTVIDGDSQARHIEDSNPDGPDVGFWSWNPNAGNSPNIIIRANNCSANGLLGVGLMGYPFWIDGSNNRISGCILSPALQGSIEIRSGAGNIVENCQLGLGTTGVGIRVLGAASGTVIIGNFIDGRNVGVSIGDGATNTRLGGPSDAERNIIVGVGHYGSEGFPTGTNVSIGDAPGAIIENNYIGVDSHGNEVNQTGTTGLALGSGALNAVVRNNVISGVYVRGVNHYANEVFGIGLSSSARNAVFQGNIIGADPTGMIPIPNYRGVALASATGATFGGSLPAQGNTVAFNIISGVTITSGTAIRVSANSIHDNGGLGIDLFPAGVTANDPGDTDSGVNNLQNFPVITQALTSSTSTAVTGVLESQPKSAYVIEVFASAACDPSGYGEGAVYLGSAPVTTNSVGIAEFEIEVAPTTVGAFITATAASANGDTSEVSACVPAAQGPDSCAADWDNSGVVDSNDFFSFITAFFAGEADFNGSGATDSQDFFDFLGAFFAGC